MRHVVTQYDVSYNGEAQVGKSIGHAFNNEMQDNTLPCVDRLNIQYGYMMSYIINNVTLHTYTYRLLILQLINMIVMMGTKES